MQKLLPLQKPTHKLQKKEGITYILGEKKIKVYAYIHVEGTHLELKLISLLKNIFLCSKSEQVNVIRNNFKFTCGYKEIKCKKKKIGNIQRTKYVDLISRLHSNRVKKSIQDTTQALYTASSKREFHSS